MNLKEIRQKRKLTQVQLANLLGTTQQQVSVMENQKEDMHLSTIKRLCKALKCTGVITGNNITFQIFDTAK